MVMRIIVITAVVFYCFAIGKETETNPSLWFSSDSDSEGRICSLMTKSLNLNCFSTPNEELLLFIDFDAEHGIIFGAGSHSRRIHVYKTADMSEKKPLAEKLGHVKGLAFDWVAGNIYWIEKKSDGSTSISVAREDGSHRHDIISRNFDRPREIVVSPVDGYMFWVDGGFNPRVERACLDGSDRNTLANIRGENYPTGLGIDYTEKKLYWSEAGPNPSIGSMNFDGGAQKVIFADSQLLKRPYALTVFDDYIYWIDRIYEDGSISRMNTSNHSDHNVLDKNLGYYITDILVDANSRQIGTNTCGENNGGCQQLCLYVGGNQSQCICSEDNSTCKPKVDTDDTTSTPASEIGPTTLQTGLGYIIARFFQISFNYIFNIIST